MTITRYTFESGVDGTDLTAGTDGVLATSASAPDYESTAAFSGSAMGVQAVSTQWATWTVTSPNHSGSVYVSQTANPGSGTQRTIAWRNGATELGAIRFAATGALAVVNSANAIVTAALATTWTAGDDFRFDWQMSLSAGTATLDLRVFKNANIDGTTADETVSRSWAMASNPDRVLVGGITTAAWTAYFDNLALSDTLEWIGPYVTNVAPNADAGTDQTVEAWTTVTLNGSASSDSDGTISSYAWSQTAGTPTVTLAGSGHSRTFTAPSVLGGTALTFQLLVTDDDAATDTDTVVITVATGDLFYWTGSAWKGIQQQWL